MSLLSLGGPIQGMGSIGWILRAASCVRPGGSPRGKLPYKGKNRPFSICLFPPVPLCLQSCGDIYFEWLRAQECFSGESICKQTKKKKILNYSIS